MNELEALPRSIGSILIFAQVGVFAVTRAVLIGALGVAAAVIGTAFIGFQGCLACAGRNLCGGQPIIHLPSRGSPEDFSWANAR